MHVNESIHVTSASSGAVWLLDCPNQSIDGPSLNWFGLALAWFIAVLRCLGSRSMDVLRFSGLATVQVKLGLVLPGLWGILCAQR